MRCKPGLDMPLTAINAAGDTLVQYLLAPPEFPVNIIHQHQDARSPAQYPGWAR